MEEAHIKDAREVAEDTAQKIKRKLNGHICMWLKISGMGENWAQCDRMRGTMINQSYSIAQLSLLVKDHKLVGPGEGW